MTDCPRLNKWIRGCKFRPRYDVGAPTITGDGWSGAAGGIYAVVEVSKPTTYVGDVCETCGAMRYKRKAPAQ